MTGQEAIWIAMFVLAVFSPVVFGRWLKIPQFLINTLNHGNEPDGIEKYCLQGVVFCTIAAVIGFAWFLIVLFF